MIDSNGMIWSIFLKGDKHCIDYDTFYDGRELQYVPRQFWPIICWALVNGGTFLGTGIKSIMLSYNVIQLTIEMLLHLNYKDHSFPELIPHFNGFKGEVKKIKDNRFSIEGRLKSNINNDTVKIKEVPIGKGI